MSTTVLATVPCRVCGHRINGDARQCPYCGCEPKRKRKPPLRRTSAARAIGRCTVCGGRMQRHRTLVERIAAALGIRRGRKPPRLACSTCGHRERAR